MAESDRKGEESNTDPSEEQVTVCTAWDSRETHADICHSPFRRAKELWHLPTSFCFLLVETVLGLSSGSSPCACVEACVLGPRSPGPCGGGQWAPVAVRWAWAFGSTAPASPGTSSVTRSPPRLNLASSLLRSQKPKYWVSAVLSRMLFSSSCPSPFGLGNALVYCFFLYPLYPTALGSPLYHLVRFSCDSQGTQPSVCDDYCPHQIMSWERGAQSPALNT